MHNVDNPFESPAILSTCSGMLGLDEGFAAVFGGRTVAYVEIEAFVAENLVRQMEQGVLAPAPVWTNVKTFPWEAFYGKLHWITGGYPCQPFSHAGLRSGSADPRHLWPYLSRGIEKSRPMGVWFENVEGHITLGLRDVLTDLRKHGYQVEVGLFSAAEVGAPHRRNRVFILGLENSFLLRMRGWNDEQRAYWRRKIQTSGSGQLADASGVQGGIPDSARWLEQEQIARAGSGMDNPAMSRYQAGDEPQSGSGVQFVGDRCSLADSNLGEQSSGRKDDEEMRGLPSEKRWAEDGSAVFGGDGAEGMAHGIGQGLEIRKEQSAREEQQAAERGGGKSRGEKSEGELRLRTQLDNYGGGLSEGKMSGLQRDSDGNGDFHGWPARPGQPQYDWEAPRLESSLGYAINGYNYREDLLRMAGNAVVHQQAETALRTLMMKFL